MSHAQLKEVYTHLEEALNDYHHVAALSSSPLVDILDLDAFIESKNDCQLIISQPDLSGTKLRNLLDSAIDTITPMPRFSVVSEQTWRLEDYLHLHYRERIPHAIIAQSLGYSEVHMTRLRNELMVEAAELILERAG